MASTTVNPVDQLAWERKWGRWAGIAAALGGIFMLGGTFVAAQPLRSDFPSVGPLQAITPALNGQADVAVNPGTKAIEFYNDHAAGQIATSVVIGLGMILTGLALVYLFGAAKGRRPITPTMAKYTALVGGAVAGLFGIGLQIVIAINAHNFVTGTDRSRDAVEAVQSSTALIVVQTIGFAGLLALAFAFVMISLNAMRAGLLTRFMGVLGMIAGALFILQFGQPLPIVQCFWLVALGALFLQRWPNGMPPAWTSGEAMPWPSQQEIREQRMRDKGIDPPAPRGRAARQLRTEAELEAEADAVDGTATDSFDDSTAADAFGDTSASDAFGETPEPRSAPNPSSSRKRRKRR